MPAKNVIKEYVDDSVYHVVNRGVEKRQIFLDAEDYAVFLNLLKRYLSIDTTYDKSGRPYTNYYNRLELLAFCLMPNHFHLLLWQNESRDFSKFIQAVCTAYAGYFNTKYSRVGTLFQGVFKAKRLNNDGYYQHISRYIHLNPLSAYSDYKSYKYSSLPYYINSFTASWVRPTRILSMFSGPQDYMTFMSDYEEAKIIMDTLKHSIADE